jgi:hypothetical protein
MIFRLTSSIGDMTMDKVFILGIGIAVGYWLKGRNVKMKDLERENSYFRDKCEKNVSDKKDAQ